MHIGGQKPKQIIQRIIVTQSITHSPTNRDWNRIMETQF